MLITTNTAMRRQIFSNPAYAREAIETLYSVQERYLFHIYGFVVMPDHCHFLVHVPSPGSISTIMNMYKGVCSLRIGIGPLWQRRFHIRMPEDAQAALRYIHENPIKAGLAESAYDYPWSSASYKWDTEPLILY